MVDYASIFDKFNQQPRNLLEAVEANRLKNQQEQERQQTLRQTQQSIDFDEQNNPLKLAKSQFDNMNEQDKFVEQELLQGSIELQPLLDAKNSQGVMQSLQMRRNKLAQAGLRTDEIDNAIQLAQQGDFDTLKQLTTSQIQAGRAIGLLNDNTQNLPAGIQYHQKLEEGRQMMGSSDPQVREQGKNIVNDIRQVLKIEKLPTGTTFDNQTDTISNIGGVEDAIGAQAYSTSYNKEDAKNVAYSGQGQINERNKVDYENKGKVNTSKAINDDIQAIKSYYDDLKIKNINNGRLTLQERQAEDARLQKERDAELQKIQTDYANKSEIEKQKQISDITTQNKISEKERIEQDKIIVNAQAVYPKIEQQAEETLNLIDILINDPSLYDATGVLQSQMPTVFQNTKDFELLKEQLSNQVFLNAYESLRGAQGITDVEGLKATLAKFQSSLSGSPKLFIESAKNLQKQITKSTRGAKNLADGKVFYKTQNNEQPETTQQPQQSNQAQERIRTYNPQTGNFE